MALKGESIPFAQRLRVRLVVCGDVDVSPLHASLQAAGITAVDDTEAPSIVLTDDYLHAELEAVNHRALRAGTPWMLLKLSGTMPWIGPWFEPGTTACWSCLAQKLQANRQLESFWQRHQGTPLRPHEPTMATAARIGADLAAGEIVRWTDDPTTALRERILTVDLLTLDAASHQLIRRPQCPHCGDPEAWSKDRPPAAVHLRSQTKKFTADGGHRTAFPSETYARFQHLISPLIGVVNGCTRRAGEVDGLMYSYTAGHNFAVVFDNVSILRQNLRGRSGGKGTTEIQSKVSAIGEAIERYSGVFRGEEEIVRRASLQDLADEAIHPQECLLFSEAQYAHRETWNPQQQHNRFHVVPQPLDPDVPIDWTPLWSLTHDRVKYLPSAYCYYGHPDLQRYRFCGSDSNGCAAGNTLEEAIFQGFLELVERDSVALWWYNRLERPAVDVDGFAVAGYFHNLRRHYASQNRSLELLDLTADLGIPVVAAVSARTDRLPQDIILGYGAHFDANIAISRALTEVNQFLPVVRFATQDGTTQYQSDDPDALRWFKTASLENQPYLVADSDLPPRGFADYEPLASNDVGTDVRTCIELARRAGLETLCLDQTRPDVGMPVCRVVVPGLRHFWRRLGPGRLYDVPVRLGRLPRPKTEAELNPVSMFF